VNTIRTSLFSALVALVVSTSIQAMPTVNFTLYVDEAGANTFNLYASSSLGDNAGIAFYGVPLLGDITSLNHNSPVAGALFAGPPFFSQVGFNLLRSADNVTSLVASQDTINASSILVYGFGQTAGSLASIPGVTGFVPGAEQVAYSAPLLIASGTYNGVAPSFNTNSVDLVSNVFVSLSSRQVVPANISTAVVPEASTIVMMSIVGLGVLCVARRRFAC
jgi:hypothetical protein